MLRCDGCGMLGHPTMACSPSVGKRHGEIGHGSVCEGHWRESDPDKQPREWRLKHEPNLAGNKLVCTCQPDRSKAVFPMEYSTTDMFGVMWAACENCKTILYRVDVLSCVKEFGMKRDDFIKANARR